VITAPTTAQSRTALTGTRLEGLTFDHSREPGIAPSRLKANVIREQLVMQAAVQNSWPAVEISRTRKCQPSGSAWPKMTSMPPPPLVTPAGSWTAKRKASSRM
jgi:hypothetical protein